MRRWLAILGLVVGAVTGADGGPAGDALSGVETDVRALQQHDGALDAQVADLVRRVQALEAAVVDLARRVTALEAAPPDPPDPPGGITLTPSGPIVARAGQVIERLKITGAGDCIRVDGVADVTIRDVDLSCSGRGIYVRGAGAKNLLVQRAHIHDLGSGAGRLNQRLGVFLEGGPSDATIEDSWFERVETGIYTVGGTQRITVRRSYFLNMLGPFPRGQCVQFDNTTVGLVEANRCEAVPADEGGAGPGGFEDNINFYNSRQITARGNWIKGGLSGSGCGILLQDANGTGNVAEDNTIIKTSQCGIGIAGGTHAIARRNKVLDPSYLNRSAVYVWLNGGSTTCSGHTVSDNIVSSVGSDGVDRPFWNGGNCGAITMSGNVFGSAARPRLTPEATKLPPPPIAPKPWSP